MKTIKIEMENIFSYICEMKTLLFSFCKYASVAIIGFFAPIYYAMWFTGIIVIVDTITGIMKAGKDDVKNIQSKKMFPIVPKLIFYFLLLITAHSVELFVISEFPCVKFALIGIGWIEIKSIDENFKILAGYSFIEKTLEGIKSINQIKRHKD